MQSAWYYLIGKSFFRLWQFRIYCLDARDQKFKRKDGETANQLIKAIAAAVSNLAQWFCAQLLTSLSIRTVMPAVADAAAKVSVDVICRWKKRRYASLNPEMQNNITAKRQLNKWFILRREWNSSIDQSVWRNSCKNGYWLAVTPGLWEAGTGMRF